ncbi:Werner syndrome ATP-dependent helicase homolog [Dendronephthya gigantea]|uniref:Werner syndrome ATP-dependent helicase homolog n=1 Tax=Dendronephthya gigantea TaxID=151771 RepID=UPI0010694B18|nr:Werner syndrome ATP-dependent helicase homolog [Dendronephthya gigantea]
MKDQVEYLQNLGIPSVAVVDELCSDPDTIQLVKNGVYTVVYGSPECFLSSETWRDIFSDTEFTSKVVGVAIDEAHCIVQWGLSAGNKKIPFRKWFGCLGELRALVPKNTKLVIVTATATKATKAQILESLDINVDQLYTVEQNPNRMNLMYMLSYMDKESGLEDVFRKLITELQRLQCQTERTIIYCMTRKQCSVLFRMFEINLGANMYNGSCLPQNRLVEMFHAGTPQSVKDHVLANMTAIDSHLRVLIATIAFGMGVNCKEIRRVIHFGPSKNLEQYVQESGRAGRDGKSSTCTILYNGLLAAYCECDMKEFLQSDTCRRQELMRKFSTHACTEVSPAHNCCDVCAANCYCNGLDCGLSWCLVSKDADLEDDDDLCIPTNSSLRTRSVSDEHKEDLAQKLLQFQKLLTNRLDATKYVSCPNVLMEFNKFHIKQVLDNCHLLFSLTDVHERIEIWRNQYACVILKVIAEVFDDIEYDIPGDLSAGNTSVFDESINSAWNELRNDSSFNHMFDSVDNTIADTTLGDTEMSEMDSNYSGNSGLFQNLLN